MLLVARVSVLNTLYGILFAMEDLIPMYCVYCRYRTSVPQSLALKKYPDIDTCHDWYYNTGTLVFKESID